MSSKVCRTTASLATVLLLTVLAARPVPLYAHCAQTSTSQADSDFWATHGCYAAFYNWHDGAYGLRSSDWTDRGWNDVCNTNLEYPLHWSAAYLLTYGLLDNNDQSFHGTVDYRATAEAAGSNFHDGLFHLISDDSNFFGQFQPPNQLLTDCPLYDNLVLNSNPASRAGDFMHEGWHAWLQKYNWNNGSNGGHRPQQGNCTINSCDYFYFHNISVYLFGDMWQNDGTANRFHSPNQVQVEFLCDVADQPQDWVPASVRQAAQADANQRAAQRFINGPGYSCGSPRPW